jgi:pimeloyl-ACP methyl ester carboxylesterase/DNA-binding SARP family transcriptional activator
MHVVLLGELRVDVDGVEVTPRSLKARALFASLAIRRGHTVTADTLLDELWPDLCPDRGRRVLQVRIAEIRKLLRSVDLADALGSDRTGYRLAVPAGATDAERFLELTARAGERAAGDDRIGASALLREALGLWAGEALAGIQIGRALEAWAAQMDELRLEATEARVEAELADGCHQRLVAELEWLVRMYPLRERFWEQLVLALYRSGRQTEALRACRSVRASLKEHSGLYPGPALRRLEAAVLAHDPSLELVLPSKTAPHAPVDAADDRARAGDARQRAGAPPVRYTRSPGGVNIAYQSTGDGPDLIVVPGFINHLDAWWSPWGARVAERLRSFCHLILFDKRGMGLSDRPPRVGITQWLEDIELVLDAVGSERAVVLGVSAGGTAATLFTAQHPERVRSLVLYGSRSRYLRGADYPFGLPPDRLESLLARVEARWGDGSLFEHSCPSAAGDAALRAEYERYERLAASPAAGTAYLRAVLEMDVRDVLPRITVPTLVVHATGDRTDPVEEARYMARRLPRATMVELASDDHLIWMSDARDELVDVIEDFVARTTAPQVASA